VDWDDRTTSQVVRFPKLLVSLNAEQQALYKAFEKAEVKCTNPFRTYLFIAPTGRGKTIAQAVLAARTKQRTLILSLTNLIRKAWYDDLKLAYGLDKKQVGLIQQNTWRIGEQFTIASIQTLARRKARWPEIFQQFGTVIVDEADTLSAPSLFNFIMAFPARYVIGATATHIGRTKDFYLQSAFGTPTKRLVDTVTDTHSSMGLRDVREITTSFKYKIPGGTDLDYHDLNEHIFMDEKRNKQIVHECLTDWEEGRCVLVAVKRVAHAVLLEDMLTEAGIKGVRVITGETNVSKKATEEVIKGIFNRRYRVIVATVNAVMRGGNLNPLDTLHVCAPVNKRELEQLIGRIRRRYKNKVHCDVRHYVDKAVSYLYNVFKREGIPTYRKLKVKRYVNLYVS
jgi:superfamily II DNA or RNA helicase